MSKGVVSVEQSGNKIRYGLLDSLRGILLLNMIAYHFFWNRVYLLKIEQPWFQSEWGYVWQQGICWSFILLSGFCWPLGRKPIRRGLEVIVGGILVAFVTNIFMPEQPIVFGILCFLGSAMLLMVVLDKKLAQLAPKIGLAVNMAAFALTRNLNDGYLGIEGFNLLQLPEWLYKNKLTTYLGFTEPGFYTSDYFSLLPWFFLFLCGYYSYHCLSKSGGLPKKFCREHDSLSFLGRNSLLIYLLHQPILYLLMCAAKLLNK